MKEIEIGHASVRSEHILERFIYNLKAIFYESKNLTSLNIS